MLAAALLNVPFGGVHDTEECLTKWLLPNGEITTDLEYAAWRALQTPGQVKAEIPTINEKSQKLRFKKIPVPKHMIAEMVDWDDDDDEFFAILTLA